MGKIFNFSSKNGDKKFLIIITQVVSIVVVMISLIVNASKYISSIVKTESASCEIINAEKKVGHNCRSFDSWCEAYEYYLYTYKYEVNGKQYNIETKDAIVNSNCKVYYSKLNPKNSLFYKFTFKNAFTNMLYILLLCEIVSWLIVLIYMVKDKKQVKK